MFSQKNGVNTTLASETMTPSLTRPAADATQVNDLAGLPLPRRPAMALWVRPSRSLPLPRWRLQEEIYDIHRNGSTTVSTFARELGPLPAAAEGPNQGRDASSTPTRRPVVAPGGAPHGRDPDHGDSYGKRSTTSMGVWSVAMSTSAGEAGDDGGRGGRGCGAASPSHRASSTSLQHHLHLLAVPPGPLQRERPTMVFLLGRSCSSSVVPGIRP
jgi:hypothetical protein